MAFSGMFLSVLYVGGALVSAGSLSAGQLMAYLLSTQTTQKSLGALASSAWRVRDWRAPTSALGSSRVDGRGRAATGRADIFAVAATLVVLQASVSKALAAGARVFDYVEWKPVVPIRGGHEPALLHGACTALFAPLPRPLLAPLHASEHSRVGGGWGIPVGI